MKDRIEKLLLKLEALNGKKPDAQTTDTLLNVLYETVRILAEITEKNDADISERPISPRA